LFLKLGTKKIIAFLLWAGLWATIAAFIVVRQDMGKEAGEYGSNFSAGPQVPSQPRDEPIPKVFGNGSAANKDQADMFSARSSIVERLSSLSPGSIQITGLEQTKPWNIRFVEPYVRVEEYADLKNTAIRINEREIISPDIILLERYTSPAEGNEYLFSATVFWRKADSERAIPKDWLPKDPSADRYVKGNPDGSASLFVFLNDDADTEEIVEMRTTQGAADDAFGELAAVSINFRDANSRKVKEIIREIAELCGLREPLQTGRWFWRRAGGIPDSDMKRLKGFIDGGLVRWHEISEWNGYPLVDGSAITWNGVLFSLQLIMGKEDSETLLKVLEPLFQNDGFSVDVKEEGRIVKILITDNFVFNFSSLWGIW
jgi:hypothetical protein